MKQDIQSHTYFDKFFSLFLASLSLFSFLVMFLFADLKSLWADDIAQIAMAWQDSVPLVISETIMRDNNPPLSHLISYIWIHLVPFGTRWLKLLNIIFVTFSITVCGLIGKELKNSLTGIFSALFISINSSMVVLAAYTFRPYGLYLLLSCLTLYFYLLSRRQQSKKSLHIIYTIILILLSYTHYFGILLCIALFFCDLFLIYKKDLKLTMVYSYFVAGSLFLPWFLSIIGESLPRLETFWPQRPNILYAFNVLKQMMGYSTLLNLFMLFSLILFSINLFTKRKQHISNYYFYFFILLVPLFIFGIVYVYSKYITSLGSLFECRYFFCIIPFLTIIMALVSEYIYVKIKSALLKHQKNTKYLLVAVSLLSILFLVRNTFFIFSNSTTLDSPFKETADFLRTQPDIQKEDSLLFLSSYDQQRGWDYYYTQKETYSPIQATWYSLEDIDLSMYNKIYVVTLHIPLSDNVPQTLEDEGFVLENTDDQLPIKVYKRIFY